MKTKFIVMAAMAAMFSMGFTACSNNDEDLAGKQEMAKDLGIGFNVAGEGSNVTRGFALNATNVATTLPNFQTWAYDAEEGGIYMGTSDNVGRTVANTSMDGSSWDYAPVQFWPVNALNFVAIAPAAPNGVTGNTVVQDGTSKVLTLTTAVTLSTTVSDQDDIMFAEADEIEKDDHTGDVPYLFKHALSQIVFKGKLPANGSITKVTISEITLGNIGKTGNLTFTSEGSFFGGTNAYIPTTANGNFTLAGSVLEDNEWDATDEISTGVYAVQPATYYTAEDDEVIAGTKEVGDLKTAATSNAFDLTISNSSTNRNAWMMLPQRTAAWAWAADPSDPTDAELAKLKAGGMASAPESGAYLKIAATLEKDGVVVLNNTDPIYIPLAANWDRSKKYTYTIEFNGLSALTPITFSVSAQDWTDGGNTDLQM